MEPIIITPRLILRRLTVEDITDDYLLWINNPDANKFLEIRHKVQTRKDCEQYITMRYHNPNIGFHFGVFEKNEGRFIGTVTFNDNNTLYHTMDISFVIGYPPAQKCGYATEAVTGACHFAFTAQSVFKITGGHYASNIGSMRVFQKNGFHIEGVRRLQNINIYGQREDIILHGALAEEFYNFHSIKENYSYTL